MKFFTFVVVKDFSKQIVFAKDNFMTRFQNAPLLVETVLKFALMQCNSQSSVDTGW